MQLWEAVEGSWGFNLKDIVNDEVKLSLRNDYVSTHHDLYNYYVWVIYHFCFMNHYNKQYNVLMKVMAFYIQCPENTEAIDGPLQFFNYILRDD